MSEMTVTLDNVQFEVRLNCLKRFKLSYKYNKHDTKDYLAKNLLKCSFRVE